MRASKTSSASRSCSGASIVIFVVRIGSTMSTEIGPILVTLRSRGARPLVNTERWTPSWTTLNAALMTPRFG